MAREDIGYSDITEDSDIDHINKVVVDEDYDADININEVVEYAEEQGASENMEKGTVGEPKVEKAVESKPEKKIEKKVNSKSAREKEIQSQKKREESKPKRHTVHKKVEKMQKKKTTKSEKKSKTTHKSEGTKLTWLWILIAIIIIAGVAFLIITLSKEKPVDKTTSEIAATVNGEPIYAKDIEDQYANLNPILQQTYTKEYILNETINQLLLIQEASDIKIPQSRIQEEIGNLEFQYGGKQELETQIKRQNLTIKEVENQITRVLQVRELLNQTIFKNIEITDDAIAQYYEQNKEKYTDPEQVTVQHILVLVNDNFTDSQAKDKIEDIEDELTSTNFCELAKKYSEDPGSKDTCGTYTFGNGEMVPEFEEASFDLEINDSEIVKTTYGYHLIKKLDYTPESTKNLSEVKEEIRGFLNDNAAQVNFDALLSDLRSKATIVNYMYKTETTITTDERETTTITTTEITQEENLDDFAKCLTEKGVKVYGANMHNNKELFGDSWQYVTYIECAVEGQPQVQTPECDEAEITGYPTWIIDGDKYPGQQSLETLAKLTGCTL